MVNTKTKKEKGQLYTKTEHPLQVMVDQATEERRILTQYITQHMVKGTDYAPIHIKKDCLNKYGCKNKHHYSKDNLTKAGAEKIKALLKLYPDFKRDNDTWEMAGSKPGLFCYRCILLTQDQKPAGVGLGACDVSEKNGNMNNAIKVAKKRAFVDAILTTGSLSDFFTQDLEEVSCDEDRTTTPQEMDAAKVTNENNGYSNGRVTQKQIGFVKGLLVKKGHTEKELFLKYEITDMSQLTKTQASTIIENLLKLSDVDRDYKEAEEIANDAVQALA
jgi:hypothetical protein